MPSQRRAILGWFSTTATKARSPSAAPLPVKAWTAQADARLVRLKIRSVMSRYSASSGSAVSGPNGGASLHIPFRAPKGTAIDDGPPPPPVRSEEHTYELQPL